MVVRRRLRRRALEPRSAATGFAVISRHGDKLHQVECYIFVTTRTDRDAWQFIHKSSSAGYQIAITANKNDNKGSELHVQEADSADNGGERVRRVPRLKYIAGVARLVGASQ